MTQSIWRGELTDPHESRLQPGDIHYWCLPTDAGHVDDIGRTGMALLSPPERNRLPATGDPEISRRWCLSRILMRRSLAWHLDEDPARLVFDVAGSGKPRLAMLDAGDLDFNLSHSGSEMLLAVAHARRVGIDLEPVDRAAKALRVAQHFFSENEKAALLEQRRDPDRHALNLWLLKEAAVKATGSTVWDGLTDMQFAIDDRKGSMRCTRSTTDIRAWQFAAGRFRSAFRFATAYEPVAGAEAIALSHRTHVLDGDAGDTAPIVVDMQSGPPRNR